jgi:hypothetical protein
VKREEGGSCRLKLVGFGLAGRAWRPEDAHMRSSDNYSRECLRYLPPEALWFNADRGSGAEAEEEEEAGEKLKKRDVWAVGQLLASLWHGGKEEEDLTADVERACGRDQMELRTAERRVRALMVRCLAKSWHQRPTAEEIVAELSAIAVGPTAEIEAPHQRQDSEQDDKIQPLAEKLGGADADNDSESAGEGISMREDDLDQTAPAARTREEDEPNGAPPKRLRLLVLDGGGMRGVVCLAETLKVLHAATQGLQLNDFDMIVGAGAGSLIALLSLVRDSVESMEALLMAVGKKCFAPPPRDTSPEQVRVRVRRL